MRGIRLVGLSMAGILLFAACGKSGGTPGAFGEKKDSAIASELPSSVASKGSVTVASDAEYAPMENIEPGGTAVVGADADLGAAMGAVLGIKFNFVNVIFDNIIPGLQSGKYDLGISSFFDTKDREKTVDMIDYFQAGEGMITLASNTKNYTSLDELCGQSVSAENGTVELTDAQTAAKKCQSEGKPAMKVLGFDTQNEVNLAVTTGRALVGLADTEVAQFQVKQTGGKVRFAGNYAAAVLYGMAVPRPKGSAPGSGPLTKSVFDALKKLFDDGTYLKILEKYGIQSGALKAPTINRATS
jgi:polar amino acid transport system substrate-binding protein